MSDFIVCETHNHVLYFRYVNQGTLVVKSSSMLGKLDPLYLLLLLVALSNKY
jgi:hypothetical protein